MRRVLLVLQFLAAAPLLGQEPVALTRGRTVERDLAHGDTVRYAVTLESRQFVYGEADQRTVDVVVTIFGPDGGQLGEFDGPARGPEPFSFRSTTAGTYRIEITPFAEETGRGRASRTWRRSPARGSATSWKRRTPW